MGLIMRVEAGTFAQGLKAHDRGNHAECSAKTAAASRKTVSRRSAEETRELLISIALDMLHEQGPTAGVGHIRLSDVVQRAQLTTGAAYRLWDGQRAFHNDLAVAAVRWRDRWSTAATMERIQTAFQSNAPLNEILRLGSEANVQTYPDDLAFLTTLALRVSAYGQPHLVDASRERHAAAIAAYAELYDQVLAHYNRRFKAPLTTKNLAELLAALAEGFGIQAAMDLPHPRVLMQTQPGVGTEWSLLAVGVVAIVNHMTEPIPALAENERTEPD